MPETVIVNEETPPPDPAASAAASAQAASVAAHEAIAQSEQAAAGLATVAAAEMEQSAERLASWQAEIERRLSETSNSLGQQISASESKLAEAQTQLSSILARLDKPPETPPNPAPSLKADEAPPADLTKPPAEPEPSPAPRRKAHRWI